MGGHASQYRYLRPLGALTLLVAEYLVVSVVFDAYQLIDEEGRWAGSLGWVSSAPPS